MSPLIEAEGLTVRYAGADVLRDVSFSLERGRVLGLVGESGAGKSMLGRVVAGTLPAGFSVGGGRLAFEGRDLAALDRPARRALLGDRIAFVPQEPLTALNPLMTVEAQFGEHLARLGVPRPARRARIVEALRSVRLREPELLLNRHPFELSGGMCQRVLIAMAFASRPALVVADEPTTALDVTTQAHVVSLLRALQADHGTAVLFITHDLRLAARVCDDLLVLYAGEVVEAGPARAVMETPRHPYTRSLAAANPNLSGPIRRLLALPDHMPGLGALASLAGCRFASRCPVRDPACEASRPALVEIAPRHCVRASPGCLAGAARLGRGDAPVRPAPVRNGSSAPVLEVRGVSKIFAGRRNWLGRRAASVVAVRDASLEVAPGEFVGVVGESGSGKSTLARLVMGLEAPSGGSIRVDGRDVTAGGDAARRVRLGALQMVFQDPQSALNPRRSVRRLVTQALEANDAGRLSRAAREARARELLTETGLPSDLLDRFPSQLSGGQKQRVNIARALCVTPRLLVADEIVSGLDVSVQAQILNLLLDLRAERGIALLMISHDLAVVRYLCSRVVVMTGGEIVEQGEVEGVFSRPRHPYTRELLDSLPPDDLDQPWPATPREPLRPATPAKAA